MADRDANAREIAEAVATLFTTVHWDSMDSLSMTLWGYQGGKYHVKLDSGILIVREESGGEYGRPHTSEVLLAGPLETWQNTERRKEDGG